MPNYMGPPKDMKEAIGRLDLPIVVELRKAKRKDYLLITDTQKFHEDVRKTTRRGELLPECADMKRIATKYGKAISAEEFEAGTVQPSLDRQS